MHAKIIKDYILLAYSRVWPEFNIARLSYIDNGPWWYVALAPYNNIVKCKGDINFEQRAFVCFLIDFFISNNKSASSFLTIVKLSGFGFLSVPASVAAPDTNTS